MNNNRHTVKNTVILNTAQVDQLATDPRLRCLVYCSALDPLTAFNSQTEIAFPQQVELRVNNDPVSGLNLRGLKNRPGSTRPADITSQILKKAHYRNDVSLTYACTNKEFAFLVQLVKTDTVEVLVEKLRRGDCIEKEAVIRDSSSHLHKFSSSEHPRLTFAFSHQEK